MTDAPDRIGAIVLAGGRSSRFGRDKLAVEIGGRTLLQLALDAVQGVATDVVVVLAPGIGAQGAAPPLPAGVTIVRDSEAYEGPLSGLASGLKALDPAIDRAIVVGGDMPGLQPAVLGRLLDPLGSSDVAVLDDGAGPRPLPMAIRPSAVKPKVDRLLADGERRLRALLAEVSYVALAPLDWRRDDPGGETLLDVDRPEDLPR